MKRKKSFWGWGIAIFYSVFVAAILGFLFYSKTVNVDLVDEDYYEKDLAYQGIIDRMNRSGELETNVTVKQSADLITISFPTIASVEDITGAVRVLRPSEKDYDLLLPVELNDDYRMTIAKVNMIKGKWVVQIEWEADGKSYYFEEALMVY